MSEDNALLMPFLTDDPVFVHGFECGQIWALLECGEVIENKPCHIENMEQITMICETFKCTYRIVTLDKHWFSLNVERTVVTGK